MTKIVKKIVKCIKCGEESEQFIVYSLGINMDNESREQLMRHVQKCPKCGYEAPDISREREPKKVYVISGPPGVGKSTVSFALAKKLPKSAYINGDEIYHQVVGGYASPWEEGNHLKTLYRLLIFMTNIYIDAGYDVIIDYYLNYEEFLEISRNIRSKNISYSFLTATKDEIIKRDSLRENGNRLGNRIIEAIDESIEEVPKEYQLDTTNLTVEDTVLLINKNMKK